MKRLIRVAALLPIVAMLTGCATPYLIDRGRDAADIFTATVEKGIGVKARVGPLAAGLSGTFGSTGLRGGCFIRETDGFPFLGTDVPIMAGSCDTSLLGLYNFETLHAEELRRRNKTFHAGEEPDQGIGIPFLQLGTDNPAYYTQVEVSVGLLAGIRLGLNPGELLDFILGWTTIDIYGDDLERKTQKEESNQ